MKRWLSIGAVAVGVFLIGAAAGTAVSRAHAKQLLSLCFRLFEDHHTHAMGTMTLIASGRPDPVYELAEDEMVLCALPPGPPLTQEAQRCAEWLKAFYANNPERKANLERRKPNEAHQLGLAGGG